MLQQLAEVVKVYPPTPDGSSGDRRSSPWPMVKKQGPDGPVTRSRGRVDIVLEPEITLPGNIDAGMEDGESRGHCGDEDILTTQCPSEPCGDIGASIGWRSLREGRSDSHNSSSQSLPTGLHTLDASVLPPSAYYLSPGWFSTGMENVSGSLLNAFAPCADGNLDAAHCSISAFPDGSQTDMRPTNDRILRSEAFI
jgi:hypothetical protein